MPVASTATGFLGEQVLAGRDRCLNVLRPKARRRGQHDVVYFRATDDLFVGIETLEAAIRRYVHAIAEVSCLAALDPPFEVVLEVVRLLLERISQRDDLHALGRA